MMQSSDPDVLDELISESWLQAWEALEGTYDGFLSDLARAWKQAEPAGAQAQSTQERGRAIGRQCRYALIVSSIKSLAGNIPSDLLAALVDKGVWTAIQGLASARHIPGERARALALEKLAPHLSEPLLQEALAAARAIEEETFRVWAFGYLAPHLSEPLHEMVLQEALAAAQAIEEKDSQARALENLAPYLSKPLLQEALTAARAIKPGFWQAEALVGLARRLGELGYQ